MKNIKKFKIIAKYLKKDKIRLTFYVICEFFAYLLPMLAAYIYGKSLEHLVEKNMYGFMIFLVGWILIYILCYSLMDYIATRLYNKLQAKFLRNLSKDLYTKIDEMPTVAFENMSTGELVNRVQNDPSTIMDLLSKLINMLARGTTIIVVLVYSFMLSIYTGIEIVIFAIIMGLISHIFLPKIEKEQEKIKKEQDRYTKSLTENIMGVREIKALGIKKNIEKSVFKNIDGIYDHEYKMSNYQNGYYDMNNAIYFTLEFIILATTGYLFIKGEVIYASFMVMLNFIGRIDVIVETISDFSVSYNKVIVSLNRIDEILNNKLYKDEVYGKINLNDIKGKIEFKNVSFKYREYEANTLNNLNMTLYPNKKNAIVGKSGNGKSTIFNLLLRYFDATDGEILIDGVNIKDLTEESLRNSISVIRQSPYLFNMSIMDNFRLVKEDITLDEVRRVCKKAYIDDYIMSLKDKYDTIIGEGGVNLSGGQKQRLAIARTLLLNTKIILFDEATSALDNESQEYIKKSIDELTKDHTIIIVAHRLSTIEDADIINVINKGRLVASGKHEELLKTCDIYRKLYSANNADEKGE